MAYQNGRWPDSALQSIGYGLFLAKGPTATSWLNMAATARAQGVELETQKRASAYRAYAMQLDMRVHPALYEILPGMTPGLPSGHGNANCKDVFLGRPNNWMIANAARWGWHRPISTDPNHWRHDGVTVGSSTAGGIGNQIDDSTPTAPQIELEQDMYRIRDGAAIYLATAHGVRHLSGEENDALSFVPLHELGSLKKVQLAEGVIGGIVRESLAPKVWQSDIGGGAASAWLKNTANEATAIARGQGILDGVGKLIPKTGAVAIDLDALAAKIAPLVKPAPIDLVALAKAVNDDLHNRTKE